MFKNIRTEEFQKLQADKENKLILDVRTPEEVEEGFIPGTSIFIDIYDPGFQEKINQLDKSKDYLVYCRAGGRSANACMLLVQNGFNGTIYNLEGGIGEWDGDISHT